MIGCETCDKSHDGVYGSGRFCSCKCARSFSTKNMSEESKQRRRESNSKSIQALLATMTEDDRKKTWGRSRPYTIEARAKMVRRLSTPEAKQKMSAAAKKRWKEHPVTDETRRKISANARASIADGRNPGWHDRNKTKKSYAEQFWSTVLDNNGIAYDFEHKIVRSQLDKSQRGCYFLDFLINGNIDLEIDGSQHLWRRERDKIRDTFLTSHGFQICRIPWTNPNNDERKKQVGAQVQELVVWLTEHGALV